ncbi:MAG: alpha/beta fold hydrolase [Myxococcales bacterium]|nr:alpha/beta fold hydrolase [Myxococcales bacterium]
MCYRSGMVDAHAAEAGHTFEARGKGAAVLCLHGLTSTPYELRPVAEALAERGHHVLVPRIIGHGTRPEALAHTRWADWLATGRRAFDRLAAEHEQVFVLGLSMGALAAIVLTHERGARVAGLVAMSTPLECELKTQVALRVAEKLPFADVLPFVVKRGGPDVSDAEVAAAMPSYDRVPLIAAASLLEGQAAAWDRAGRIAAPVLVQHGRRDHVAPLRNAQRLMRRLTTRHKRAIIYARSWHILPLDVEHEAVVADVCRFVDDPIAMTSGRAAPVAEAR